MTVLSTDLLLIERGGTAYRATVSELPSGGGTAIGGLATITVPNKTFDWTETVAAVGVTPASRIMIAVAPHLDDDENDASMLAITGLSATPGTDTMAISIAFSVPANGPIKLNWSAL